MPFREKLKKTFQRNSISAAEEPPLTLITSTTITKNGKKKVITLDEKSPDWPEHVYKPSEMPRTKYRAPPDKKHTAKLQSFSFSQTWKNARRRSGVSLYSPMGSRMPSRIGSVASAGSSNAMRSGPSRGHSLVGETLAENESRDDDIGNVGGLSRQHTQEDYKLGLTSSQSQSEEGNTLSTTKTVTETGTADEMNGRVFSPEDLNKALTATKLTEAIPAEV